MRGPRRETKQIETQASLEGFISWGRDLAKHPLVRDKHEPEVMGIYLGPH